MRRLFLFVFVLIPACLSAQSNIEKKSEDLKSRLEKPLAEWGQSDVTEITREYLGLFLDLLWDQDFRVRRHPQLPKKRPHVVVRLSGGMRTPYIDREDIVIPLDYLQYLLTLGRLIGHDVYASGHFIHLENPLLNTPYRKSLLLPLLFPLPSYLTIEAAQVFQPYLGCPERDSKCSFILNNTVSGIILFLILHELSHEVFHHVVKDGEYNLANEIAADKNAAEVLSTLVDEMPHVDTELRTDLAFAFRAVPIVWLNTEAQREDVTQASISSRKKSLMDQLPHEMQDRIEEMVNTTHSNRNLAWLEIKWSEPPGLLLINGTKMPVNEVIGQRLIISPRKHTIVAVHKDSIAVAEAEPNTVSTLLFHQLRDCDTQELQRKLSQERWGEVLLCTSDNALSARSSSLARSHFFALHGLGLDDYINVEDWNAIPEADWKTLFKWQNDYQPLRSWF